MPRAKPGAKPRSKRTATPRSKRTAAVKLAFFDYDAPASEEKLAAAETRLRVRLPDDFRAFVQEHNGTSPEPGNLRLEEPARSAKDGRVALAFILGIGARPSMDVERLARDYRGRIPEGFVPIGRDPGASLFLMRVSGEPRGAVYFWDSEAERPEGPSLDNVHLAARSFTALLAKLSR